MEVLFEYRGSRRQITVAGGESITECVTAELRRIGRSSASVHTADVSLDSTEQRNVYLLQKWSPQWDCYVDVRNASEIRDGDRLTVMAKPRPPSKMFQLLCCCCASADSGVVLSRKHGVSKNEEIQALDYRFGVESDTHSDWEGQSLTLVEDKAADDAHYVRDERGRASWKMVPQEHPGTVVSTTEESEAVVEEGSEAGEADEAVVEDVEAEPTSEERSTGEVLGEGGDAGEEPVDNGDPSEGGDAGEEPGDNGDPSEGGDAGEEPGDPSEGGDAGEEPVDNGDPSEGGDAGEEPGDAGDPSEGADEPSDAGEPTSVSGGHSEDTSDGRSKTPLQT